jgi:glycosyltransferase involved in cell wall biosynthesis
LSRTETTDVARPVSSSRAAGAQLPTVTIIVPTYNRARYLPHLFAALSAQVYPAARMELIVVDNSSSDDTEDVVQQWAEKMPIPVRFHRKDNKGPAASRNVGASLARGEVLAYTDSDCIPEPTWLINGVGHLAHADIVCGPMFGLIGEYEGKLTCQVKQAVRDDGTFPTGNLILWRTWFDAVDGFDESFGIYPWGGLVAGEDTDMVWRAKRKGAVTSFHHDVVVGHQPTPSKKKSDVFLAPLIVQIFPRLIRNIPELRDTKLHRRYFLSAEQLRFEMGLVGVGLSLATRRKAPLVLMLPFFAIIRPTLTTEVKLNGPKSALNLFGIHVYSALANLAALSVSSVRNRCLVL